MQYTLSEKADLCPKIQFYPYFLIFSRKKKLILAPKLNLIVFAKIEFLDKKISNSVCSKAVFLTSIATTLELWPYSFHTLFEKIEVQSWVVHPISFVMV